MDTFVCTVRVLVSSTVFDCVSNCFPTVSPVPETRTREVIGFVTSGGESSTRRVRGG